MSVVKILMSSENILHEAHLKVTVRWQMKNLFSPSAKDSAFIDSPVFKFYSMECFLRFYPNGRTGNNTVGWISMYLWKTSYAAIQILCTISIGNNDDCAKVLLKRRSLFPKERHAMDIHNLILRSQLLDSKNTSNEALTIFCTAEMRNEDVSTITMNSSYQTSLTSGLETLSKQFKELFLDGTQGDIEIILNEKRFLAHRIVLIARSSVFRSLLETPMSGKSSGVINITNCNVESFQDFLLFLYSGQLDIVTPSNALSLYLTSDKYDVQELKKACSECLAQEISVESFCEVASLSSLYGDTELLAIASEFFMKNANAIFETSRWLTFMGEHVTLVIELLIKLFDKFKNC